MPSIRVFDYSIQNVSINISLLTDLLANRYAYVLSGLLSPSV